MLTIKFPGHPKSWAIIADGFIGRIGGMIECTLCNRREVLMVLEIEEISTEIEKFIKNHDCVPLAREKEVLDFCGRLKQRLPGYLINVTKGGMSIS